MASMVFSGDHRDMSSNRWNLKRLTPWGRAHLAWAVVMVGGLALMLGGAALSEQPEGTCSGIGWGCTVSGPDSAVLLLFFLGPVAAAVLLAGHLVIGVVHWIAKRIHRDVGSAADPSIEPAWD